MIVAALVGEATVPGGVLVGEARLIIGVPSVGVVSVPVITGRLGIGVSSTSSNGVPVNSPSSVAAVPSIEGMGSVPRKIYLNGVSVGSTAIDARDEFTRPIRRMIKIPKMEKPPIRIGRRMERSMDG